MMKYVPVGTVPTVNANGVKTPPEVNVHAPIDVSIAGTVLEIWGQGAANDLASAAAKLLPETVTSVPTGPNVGVNVIVGPVTVNTASAISPTVKPVTSMTYEPGGTLPTLNENGSRTPPEVNVHAPAAVITAGVGLEIWGQGAPKGNASAGAKALPETVTTVPIGPVDGVSVIVGTEAVTMNMA
jgi:hypothetical protein